MENFFGKWANTLRLSKIISKSVKKALTIKIKGEIESLKENSKEKQKFQIQTKPHFMNWSISLKMGKNI